MKEFTIKAEPLLRCPFCGGDAVVEEHFKQWDGRYYEVTHISCRSCWCSSKTISEMECKDRKKRKEEAIKSWNTRKPMERILERLEDASFTKSLGNVMDLVILKDKAIEIVKEGGIE